MADTSFGFGFSTSTASPDPGPLTWSKIDQLRRSLDGMRQTVDGAFGHMLRLPIIESTQMVERVLYARSPARARRRERRGYAQNYIWRPMPKVIQTPHGLIMHPTMARQLRELARGR